MDSNQKRAWWLVAILFAEMFFVHGAFIILPLYMVPMEQALHWNRIRSSSLQTVSMLSMGAIGMPVAGWLLDWIDASVVLTGGILLLSGGFILAALSHSYVQLLIAYFLIGVGDAAASFVPCAVVVSNWFGQKRRGVAMGLALAGMSVGGMVLFIVVNRIIKSWGWRLGYGVIPFPILAIILPLVLWQVRSRPPGAAVKTTSDELPEGAPGFEIGEALRTRAFWLLAFVQFTYQIGLGAIVAHSIPFLSTHGYSRTVAVRAFGIATGLAGVGKVLMGWIADRTNGRVTLSMDLLVNAIGVALLFTVSNTLMLVLWDIVWGLTIIAPLALIPLVVIDCFGLKRLGSLVGFLYFFSAIGGAIGPVSMGWLYVRNHHSYTMGVEIVIVVMIISGLSALGCVAPKRKAAAQPEVAPGVAVS